jgi:transposase
MSQRRLVGIDLGIASAHTVRVLDECGATIAKRKCWPTVESLAEIEAAALTGAPVGTVLEVIVEPTGPAWLPIAVFFIGRGHLVYRVSSAKASDLRKFFSHHTKTNGIDADTLARLGLVDPAGLQALQLAGPEAASLDRRVRATDRLSIEGAVHKRRIKDLVRQLMPMTPLTGDLGGSDLVVLERWADPNVLVKVGANRLGALIAKESRGHQGAERAAEWIGAAEAAIELYGGHPAVAFADLAAEVATEVRLLRAIQSELAVHAAAREHAYRYTDIGGLARSLPGFGEVGAPALVAIMGEPSRFASGKKFVSFSGLAPRASETGNTDRKGQPMSKAGPVLLRTTLVRAADTARKQDPQLARIYYTQMVERGKNHLGAVCVVAAALAERAWAVMDRGMPYVICDNDDNPVTPEEAKAIIAERWTVPAEVRIRRRCTKAGKAPRNVPTERSKPPARSAVQRGDLPRPTSSSLAG